MTPHTRTYRLVQQDDQQRLDELTDREHESVADLTHEIGMCRFLIERATGSAALCGALLSTSAKLCVSHQLTMERAGTTLLKETVLRICLRVAKLVSEKSPTCPAHKSGSTGPSTRSTPCSPNWLNRQRNSNRYALPMKGQAMRIEYDATRKKYLLDTEVTTRVTALAALRAKGLRWTKADLLLRLCKLAATLNRYFDALEREPMRGPQPDPISYEEFRSVFCNMLANALDRRALAQKSRAMGPGVYSSREEASLVLRLEAYARSLVSGAWFRLLFDRARFHRRTPPLRPHRQNGFVRIQNSVIERFSVPSARPANGANAPAHQTLSPRDWREIMSDNSKELKNSAAEAEKRAGKWQELHTEATIKRELTKAAEEGGAVQHRPTLLLPPAERSASRGRWEGIGSHRQDGRHGTGGYVHARGGRRALAAGRGLGELVQVRPCLPARPGRACEDRLEEHDSRPISQTSGETRFRPETLSIRTLPWPRRFGGPRLLDLLDSCSTLFLTNGEILCSAIRRLTPSPRTPGPWTTGCFAATSDAHRRSVRPTHHAPLTEKAASANLAVRCQPSRESVNPAPPCAATS